MLRAFRFSTLGRGGRALMGRSGLDGVGEGVRHMTGASSMKIDRDRPETNVHVEVVFSATSTKKGDGDDKGKGSKSGEKASASQNSADEDFVADEFEGIQSVEEELGTELSLKPREVVERLDEYIVGQKDAKRAIAIALRNRWRRMRVPDDLRPEIMPKNILMVGPTGVGKTEVARRLAKLARAPFVKVEATKFTEVGFHGRDVDTIIRDLVEASMVLVREVKTESLRRVIAPEVEEILLRALVGDENQVDDFRDLLRDGLLEDRVVEVDVPQSTPGGAGEDGMDMAFGTAGPGGSIKIDAAELVRHLSGSGGGGIPGMGGRGRTERKRLPIKEARPLLEQAELERRLSAMDLKKEAVDLAEQHGIVFIDEIDKIVADKTRYRGGDASDEGVQRDLLPLIEGSQVEVRRFGNVKTDHMLFVCSGAFHTSKPSDMLAELQGRLPIRVELQGLDVADLLRILTEPKANLIEQQKALIGAEGVKLDFTDGAIKALATFAAEMNRTVENIGARRLHTVIERVMDDISYDAADMKPGSTIVVDKNLVASKLKDALKVTDLRKFIL